MIMKDILDTHASSANSFLFEAFLDAFPFCSTKNLSNIFFLYAISHCKLITQFREMFQMSKLK